MKKHIIRSLIFLTLLSSVYACGQQVKKNSLNEPNGIAIGDNHIRKDGILWYHAMVDVLWLISGICIGGYLVYLYSKRKIYSVLTEEKLTYLGMIQGNKSPFYFRYIGVVNLLKMRKDEKKKEIEKLNIENQRARNEIENLKLKMVSYADVHDNSSERVEAVDEGVEPKVIEWKIDPEVKIKAVDTSVFFTIPENDGSFNIRNGKSAKDIESFYRIEIDENGQNGKLHFVSSDYDLRALDNIDYYLNPVCEIENILDRVSAQKIAMVAPGAVSKSGDFWKVDVNNKVKIKLV